MNTDKSFADKKIIKVVIRDSFRKLNIRSQLENPVMFMVFLSAILTTLLWIISLFGIKDAASGYTITIAIDRKSVV